MSDWRGKCHAVLMRQAKPSQLFVLAMVLIMLQGCSNISYYSQSINGHLNIVSASQPAVRVLDDPKTAPQLKEKLTLAHAIRQFAIDRLALPDNDSYRTYVDTKRDYVTWSVFAAPEFSLDVSTWCFPVAGCVPYRGYFSKDAAVEFANGVRAKGLDVHVGGVPAYSTLGWFDDPLLNTMFLHGDTYLAGVIFHELSHQRVYVAGDPAFNEAFAVSVERSGIEAWLHHRADEDALRGYATDSKRNADFLDLIADARSELKRIYTSADSAENKRAAKAAALERLRARYRRVRDTRWNGYDGYNAWFEAPINNAKLATISVYNNLVPAFDRLLDICSGDHQRYFKAVERIAKLEQPERLPALHAANECD